MSEAITGTHQLSPPIIRRWGWDRTDARDRHEEWCAIVQLAMRHATPVPHALVNRYARERQEQRLLHVLSRIASARTPYFLRADHVAAQRQRWEQERNVREMLSDE